MASLDALTRSEPVNAALSWLFASVVVLAAVESVFTAAYLWAGFAFLVAAVTAVPPLLSGDWTMVVPWPLPLVAAAAAAARAVGLYPEIAGYVAVAALALVAVVELDAFTSVEMSRRFAVAFAAMTTLAVQALWTVAQFASDVWLGTDFLTTQRELQVDIVAVTVVAVVMGAAFQWYFARFEHAGSHEHPTVTRSP
ncbi:hypothetical protein G9464_10080 [Halostella sp. JP-L12]|uniref:hypothetical protein n=1 Tax=Halostella TaxID=1843185 RepID=UPI000EF7C8E1|nr:MULTISPECIES: hypothetical protein [Halostella]NHN47943.1 hypothetical protein [Halostella sp. JP-L12]